MEPKNEKKWETEVIWMLPSLSRRHSIHPSRSTWSITVTVSCTAVCHGRCFADWQTDRCSMTGTGTGTWSWRDTHTHTHTRRQTDRLVLFAM